MLDFFAPFAAIALAELGDKSQLSIFLLSTRTKRHFLLLLGVMCGFALVRSEEHTSELQSQR